MFRKFFNQMLNILKASNKSSDHDDVDREKLQQRFLKRDSENKKVNDFIDSKNQSMKDSQGASDFSGSAYNGPGNVDHEKRHSNMSQRNF